MLLVLKKSGVAHFPVCTGKNKFITKRENSQYYQQNNFVSQLKIKGITLWWIDLIFDLAEKEQQRSVELVNHFIYHKQCYLCINYWIEKEIRCWINKNFSHKKCITEIPNPIDFPFLKLHSGVKGPWFIFFNYQVNKWSMTRKLFVLLFYCCCFLIKQK